MSDADFEGLLREAAEALAGNDPAQAEQTALAALRQQPGNPLAQNLVGLSYFGQGRHDQALEVFDSLARRNADVVPLRINAGVAALSAGDRSRAETHLRRAIDLDARQRRAFAYLALVHLENGQNKLARAALSEAGLTELVERLDAGDLDLLESLRLAAERIPPTDPAALPWEGFTELAALGGGAPVAEPAAAPDADSGGAEPGTEGGGEGEGQDGAFENLDAAFAQLDGGASGEQGQEAREQQRSEASVPAAPAAEPSPVVAPDEPLLQPESRPRTTDQRLMALKPMRSTFCFAVFPKVPDGAELSDVELHNAAEEDDRRCLVIGARALSEGVCLRSDLLAMARGALRREPLALREKGARTGPMTLCGRRFEEARGEGSALLVTDPADCFEIVRLADEACFVAESAVAAFSSGLRWERGRVPGTTLGALEVVGRGFVALSCRAPLERIKLREGQQMVVRSDCLVGWGGSAVPVISQGALSPAGAEASAPSPSEAVPLEVDGQGVVVLCLAGGVAGGLNLTVPPG